MRRSVLWVGELLTFDLKEFRIEGCSEDSPGQVPEVMLQHLPYYKRVASIQ